MSQNLNDTFDRVQQLVSQIVEVKRASAEQTKGKRQAQQQLKRAERDIEQTLKQYDVGTKVDPKQTSFTEEIDRILTEAFPSITTAHPEATVGSEDEALTGVGEPQGTETTTVLQDGPGAETVGIETGEDAEQELNKESALSDEELFRKYNKAAGELIVVVREMAMEPWDMYDDPNYTKEANLVAKLVKQAEMDADMLAGYLASATREGVKNGTSENETILSEEPSAEELAKALQEVGVTPEELETAAEAYVPQENVGATLAGNPSVEAIVDALVEAGVDPNEVEEAVQELQQEITEVVGEVAGGVPTEGISENETILSEEPSAEELAKALQEVGVTPEALETAAEAYVPQENVGATLAGNPSIDEVVDALVEAGVDPNEIEEAVAELQQEITEAVGEVVGGVPTTETTTPEAEDVEQLVGEEGGEAEQEEEPDKTASERKTMQELGNALQELGLTPDELVKEAKINRAEEAKKVATAIKNFKRSGNFKLTTANTFEQRKLRDRMKAYLLELVSEV